MRRIVTWAMSTLTVLVLLFSYHTSRSSVTAATAETRSATSSSGQGAAGSSSSGGTSNNPSGSSNSSSSSSKSSSGSSSSSSGSQTVAGDAVMTRYGPVQVQITVSNGKISAADVLQVPMQDRHDQMINSQAVPIYNSEAVDAQSAQIDTVSGATFTWEGYTQSLQSAIDKAHL